MARIVLLRECTKTISPMCNRRFLTREVIEMNAYQILTLALLLLSGISFAAEETPAAKPNSGSATTAQESPSHPATGSNSANENKTGAATSIEQSATHPATAGKATPDVAPNISGRSVVRNWAEIDTNHDNSISPDEMQKFLEKGWVGAKKSS
jgi:hypothetical protein